MSDLKRELVLKLKTKISEHTFEIEQDQGKEFCELTIWTEDERRLEASIELSPADMLELIEFLKEAHAQTQRMADFK